MKELSSGQNDNDLMKAANDLFFNDHHMKFTLEHAWRELRHDQKWASTSSHAKDGGGKSKRRRVDEGSAQSSTSEPVSLEEDEVMGRAPGVKAAKAKANKSGSKRTTVEEKSKALTEFQCMWEIKKQDLQMKDKLSNKKLLDSLLGKLEPLSDIEMALKNKLISDMLA